MVCMDHVPLLEHSPARLAAPATHTLICGENLEVLPRIAGELPPVDVIYLDPPYNTGKREWMYDDDRDDWGEFMRERLIFLRGMLADDGVVAASIGAQQVHELANLIQRTFTRHRVHMVTVEVSGGKSAGGVRQVAEYLLLALPAGFRPAPLPWALAQSEPRQPWEGLALSTAPKGRWPNQVYPVYVDRKTRAVVGVGDSLQDLLDRGELEDATVYRFSETTAPAGSAAVWPITRHGRECSWRLSRDAILAAIERGHIKADPTRMPGNPNQFSVKYLPAGATKRVESGEIDVLGRDDAGALILRSHRPTSADIPTIWARKEHHTARGTARLRELIGENTFPYPKSVALIRDILLAVSGNKPDAVVLDPFAGAATTFDAVCELNAADNGGRRAVLVTNDDGGIFKRVAVPRVRAVAAEFGVPVSIRG